MTVGVRNGAAKEDGHWDLNLGVAAIEIEGHAVLKGKGEDHEVLECFFLPRGLGSRRDFARKKGEKGLLLVGHEKVPHGFGLTGDCSSHTAAGAGSLIHGLLLFLRYRTPDWAQGEGRTVHLWLF